MGHKNNIRSMRFSDATIELIESMDGSNFTAKFEILINKCVREIPRRERELEDLNRAIRERREQLGRMTNKIEGYRRRLQNLDSLMLQLEKEVAKAQEHEW